VPGEAGATYVYGGEDVAGLFAAVAAVAGFGLVFQFAFNLDAHGVA
jgi:hypothetical protein